METKERILWEALDLFSHKGYAGVSVRDIARAVGIRESSLYSHFAGKQEIFQSIVDICLKKAEEYYRRKNIPFSQKEDLSVFDRKGEALEETLLDTFRYFFEDPWNLRFRRLLAVSRFEDERAGELYKELYCRYPMEIQAAVFRNLLATGKFLPRDPEALALEFYGSVYLLMNLCETWEEAQGRLRDHIRLFVSQNLCPDSESSGEALPFPEAAEPEGAPTANHN